MGKSSGNKILLIHGYGVGLEARPFSFAKDEYHGFNAWKDEVDKGEAEVFSWKTDLEINGVQLFNLYNYLRLYRSEQVFAAEDMLHAQLSLFIKKNKPSTIICHSMGCYVMAKYLEKNTLPNTVVRVVFIQADLDANWQKPQESNAEFVVIQGRFDTSLLASVVLNKKLRLGQRFFSTQTKLKVVYWNHWYWNNHHHLLCDKRLRNHIMNIQ